jgi:hypothetical protein
MELVTLPAAAPSVDDDIGKSTRIRSTVEEVAGPIF